VDTLKKKLVTLDGLKGKDQTGQRSNFHDTRVWTSERGHNPRLPVEGKKSAKRAVRSAKPRLRWGRSGGEGTKTGGGKEEKVTPKRKGAPVNQLSPRRTIKNGISWG